jgi:hypothetical protein
MSIRAGENAYFMSVRNDREIQELKDNVNDLVSQIEFFEMYTSKLRKAAALERTKNTICVHCGLSKLSEKDNSDSETDG